MSLVHMQGSSIQPGKARRLKQRMETGEKCWFNSTTVPQRFGETANPDTHFIQGGYLEQPLFRTGLAYEGHSKQELKDSQRSTMTSKQLGKFHPAPRGCVHEEGTGRVGRHTQRVCFSPRGSIPPNVSSYTTIILKWP